LQLLIKGENMRKIALVVVGSLLIASNVFAGNASSLDADALAKTILNMHKFSGSEKGSFAIVYGGQDISRGLGGAASSKIGSPVFVG
jgi:hypothetical protein